MRGTVADLASPYELQSLLPAVLMADPFTIGLTAGLDCVLAPIISALDCLPAYLDPKLAPTDFLEWLAGGLGLVLDEKLPSDRRRLMVDSAVELHRLRGTTAGLRTELELASGCPVDIADSGGTTWSIEATTTKLSDHAQPSVTVTVRAGASASVDTSAIEAVLQAVKPAHVAHELKVVDP